MSRQREMTRPTGPMGGRPGGPGGSIGRPIEKARNFKGTLHRLLGYLKPQRLKLSFVVVFAILSTVFSIVGPKIMGQATTIMFEGIMNGGKINFDAIWRIVLTLIVLYLLSSLFSYAQQYIMAGVAQKIVYNLRKDVDEKLTLLPLRFFDARTHGEILSRVTNDVDNIANTLQQSLTQLITSVVTIIGVIVMMLTISPLLTLIVLLTLPLYILVTSMIAKHSQRFFAAQQKSLGELNGHVEEMFTGHVIIKAFGHERKSIETFKEINDRLYDAGWKAQFISGIIMPLMRFVSNLGYVIVSVVGGDFRYSWSN